MIAATLDELTSDIQSLQAYGVTQAYWDKQMHRIPKAPVVDRAGYILGQCQGKRVLHLGCSSGPLHSLIAQVSESIEGWDIEPYIGKAPGDFVQIDLDEPLTFRKTPGRFDLIVVAEILEHLSNPGQLLRGLKEYDVPLLLTVPNAFSSIGRRQVQGGIENVHWQHVAWYSYHTLLALIQRYGYEPHDFCWYNCPQGAQPQEAEGLIMLIR